MKKSELKALIQESVREMIPEIVNKLKSTMLKETDVDVSFITETIIEPTGKKNKIEPIHNSGGKSVMDWYTNKKMTNPNPGYQEPLANRNTVDEYMKKIGLKK